MPYNENVEKRINEVTKNWENTNSKKMFGGICNLINGNMFCGVYKDYLILRLGEEEAKKQLMLKNTKEFDITGRPMKGWVMVDPKGFNSGDKLKKFLELARKFIKTLPAK